LFPAEYGSPVTRRALVACLLLCVALAGAPGAGASLAADGTAGPASEPAALAPTDGLAQTAPANATNATNGSDSPLRHRDPETYNRQGNTEALRQRLAGQLAARLQGGALNVSEGEYEAANGSVDAEYRDLLSRYVEVAGDTGADTESGDAFEDAAEAQRTYTSAVARYRATYDAYREAERAGNTTRMRRLARELDRLAARIDESGATLRDSYATIENTTGEPAGTGAVNETTTNVTTTQRAVTDSLFVDTALSLSGGAPASFADPLPVRGRLRAANGTALANRSVTLSVGARRVETTTNATGAFAVDYRPTLVATGERTVPVRYEPAAASVYRSASANLTTTVTATDATLSLADVPESARFGEALRANATLRAAGRPVPGVPLRATLGGFELGTGTTDANGSLPLAVPLPAAVATGEAPLTAELAVSGRAIAAANRSVPVRVRGTDPTLSLDATRNGTVNASGRLAANGEALGNRTLRVTANGTALGTVETDRTGAYAASFALDGPARLRVAFDGEGNLRDAAASARIGGRSVESTATLPGGWPWLAAALALLGGGVGFYALRGRGGPPSEPDGSAPAPDPGAEPDTSASGPDPAETLAERAVEHREAGEFDAAVRTAYAAARAAIDADAGAATHWEFYRRAGLSGRTDEALYDLTAAYERAAFAPEGADESAAADALDRLADLR
jgi:hypothetical protein